MRKICAYCKDEIKPGDSYYSFQDKFLQAEYFDKEEDNFFCSKDCACKALLLTEIEDDRESDGIILPESPLIDGSEEKPSGFRIQNHRYAFHNWVSTLATYLEYLADEYSPNYFREQVLNAQAKYMISERRMFLMQKGKPGEISFYAFYGFRDDEKTYKMRNGELYMQTELTVAQIRKIIFELGKIFWDTQVKWVKQ